MAKQKSRNISINQAKECICFQTTSRVLFEHGRDLQKIRGLSKIVANNIGCINIPEIYHYKDVTELKKISGINYFSQVTQGLIYIIIIYFCLNKS
jgi:hypothetical protein